MLVDVLRDGTEAHIVFLEELVQSGKIVQGPGQPVQFVDHDEIDFPGLNVREEFLQCGAIGIPPAVPAVVVMLRQADPGFFRLNADIVFAGLPLSVQRIEFGIEIFIRALARVDRAADRFDFGSLPDPRAAVRISPSWPVLPLHAN